VNDVAIYHPSINLPDSEWLQFSLLYWKRLLRIVPPEDERRGPRHLSLLEEADLIKRIDPTPALADAARDFLTFLEANQGRVGQRYEISSGSAWKGFTDIPWEADPGMAYLHSGKIDSSLREALVESGLAVWDPVGWIGTHPRLARAYMSYLAAKIGRASAASPVTDDPLAHLLGCSGEPDELAEMLVPHQGGDLPQSEQAVETLALISVRAVAPDRPLTFDQILDVRAKYGHELLRFRALLADTIATATLEAVSRPDAFQMHLTDLYQDRVAPELTRLKRDLKLLKLDTIEASLNLRTTLPPALALAAGKLGLQNPGVLSGAAAIASLVTVSRGITSSRREILDQSPVAFLWRIDQMDSQTGLDRLLQATLRQRQSA
jgi:hypothetical protein